MGTSTWIPTTIDGGRITGNVGSDGETMLSNCVGEGNDAREQNAPEQKRNGNGNGNESDWGHRRGRQRAMTFYASPATLEAMAKQFTGTASSGKAIVRTYMEVQVSTDTGT